MVHLCHMMTMMLYLYIMLMYHPQNCQTPLHIACQNSHDKVVEMLLVHGADAQAKNKVSTVPPPPSFRFAAAPAPAARRLCAVPRYARPFFLWLLFFFPALPLLPPISVRPLSLPPAPRFVSLYLSPASLF